MRRDKSTVKYLSVFRNEILHLIIILLKERSKHITQQIKHHSSDSHTHVVTADGWLVSLFFTAVQIAILILSQMARLECCLWVWPDQVNYDLPESSGWTTKDASRKWAIEVWWNVMSIRNKLYSLVGLVIEMWNVISYQNDATEPNDTTLIAVIHRSTCYRVWVGRRRGKCAIKWHHPVNWS